MFVVLPLDSEVIRLEYEFIKIPWKKLKEQNGRVFFIKYYFSHIICRGYMICFSPRILVLEFIQKNNNFQLQKQTIGGQQVGIACPDFSRRRIRSQ